MRHKFLSYIFTAALLATSSVYTVVAQDVRVEVGKRTTLIPKVCESVTPASLEGKIDVLALVKEAICKGAGDMLIEYTYLMKSAERTKHKKGGIREETTTYEVYMPVFKSGVPARGVLLVTERNGISVPPDELEKERMRAGERLEKEEKRIERVKVDSQPGKNSAHMKGLIPLGMYPRTRVNRESFGFNRGRAGINIHAVLINSDLTFQRREQLNGRDTLVFNFTPRLNAQFDDAEEYIAQLTGTIWIDASDRIVSRLAGWPVIAPNPKKATVVAAPAPSSPALNDAPPAIYVEMMRLPEGIWLPGLTRLNGLDHPKLFDGITSEIIFTYSEYKRFNTETFDPEMETPKPL